MLKRIDLPLAFAITAAAAVIAAVFLAGSSPSRLYSDQKAGKSAEYQAIDISVADRAAIKVAEYTEVLAWFTAVLAVASIFQGYFLIRADKTARTAADAAKASADIVPQLERPHLYVSKMRASYSFAVPGYEPPPTPTEPHVTLTVHNYGRTPANIETAVFRIRLMDHVPSDSDDIDVANALRQDLLSPIEMIIAAGQAWEQTFLSENTLGTAERAWMLAGHGLYCWGYVNYRDIFGRVHSTHFCRRLVGGAGHFVPIGGMEKNYGV
jgi:hypothetical protein